jgi:hypothetical protein
LTGLTGSTGLFIHRRAAEVAEGELSFDKLRINKWGTERMEQRA